ncbi:MAG: hypothetical protein PHS57_07295 [Alphaproteobacteria bacterium]|nr:hypothetical protein [Alphaproteobacteria bacterium]
MATSSRRGFSLTETAIVLGVAGLILSGVWVMVGGMRSSAIQTKFSDLLAVVVENIRGTYVGKASFESTSPTKMMPILRRKHVFPGDVVRKESDGTIKVVSPFGGELVVCGWKASGSTKCETAGETLDVPFFAVEIAVDKKDCINAVVRNANSSLFPGLLGVYINGTKRELPISFSAAQTGCSKASNIVDFVFRLLP